ncbi:MAG: hypothetical protein LBE09_07945 [Christensenellaceae bacterium]|jgi:hypothetical protein|nr:hypothetical protein [Christensenellaceae bacterium]
MDIDIDYVIGSNEKMQKDRDPLKPFTIRAMSAKGYFLTPTGKAHYALKCFVFSFTNSACNKININIELNDIDRIYYNRRFVP